MARTPAVTGKMALGDVVRFTGLASLFAIFLDAAVAHGLLWENDPYWTYWITKTFLLASVIGLGTAWVGIGAKRGAAIMAVHALVLTIYYWSFAPIGLPSSPEWLDLEHTWITGVPIHYAVLYAGYLAALWLWRRRAIALTTKQEEPDAGTVAWRALIVGAALVLVGGGLASAALGDMPGATWFLTRVLLTVPLLMFWWSWAGRDATASVTGAIFIALVWAAYGQFLGPSGLPDTDLRILDPDAPPAALRWLDYRELWVISFPIYLVVSAVILLIAARWTSGSRPRARAVAPAAALALLFGATGFTIPAEDRGQDASLSASGEVALLSMDGTRTDGTGEIRIDATEIGARVTPLPPHDRLDITAKVTAGGRTYEIVNTKPMISDPLGRHTTWWGVGFDVEHHGRSGIGARDLPPITSELAGFAVGDLRVDGELVATAVPVHVMTAETGIPGRLALEVGDADISVPELPGGRLRAIWPAFVGAVSERPKFLRYAAGSVVLAFMLVALVIMNRRAAAALPE